MYFFRKELFHNFMPMSIFHQAQYLFDFGEFIGDKEVFGCKKLLYALNGKFYEITYHAFENMIDHIEFRSLEYAAKYYSDMIDIEGL